MEWVLEQQSVDGNFSNKIFFNDGVHFTLGGYVNKQNCRYCLGFWESLSNWRESITSRKNHCLAHSLVRRCDWILLLRKRRWNDGHRQFGALWSDFSFFVCYWRIRLGEYVFSTRLCHMPHNSSEYGFIVRDISWPLNFSSWRYQLATKSLRFDTISGAMRKTVFLQINLQLLST